jgi:D-3-phosphoglycerate dehydrogenase
MTDTLTPLVDDLLDSIGRGRPYRELMDAWRTSCPRLPVWEEANLLGYVHCTRDAEGVEHVVLTTLGEKRLQQVRRRYQLTVRARAG